jgi:TolA-binding protein
MRSSIPAVLVAAVVMLLAGCGQPQQQEVPNEKQARLVAAQSVDLQKQLAARDADIAILRQKHVRDLQQRDEELAQCKARIDTLEKDIQKGIAERVAGVMSTIMDENVKLRREIEQLKAELHDPKKQSEP